MYSNPSANISKRGIHDVIDHDEKNEENIDEYNKNNQKVIRSCCFEIDRSIFIIMVKVFISTSVICLSSYQLISLKECQFQSLYSSLISGVVAYWLSNNKH